MQIGVKEKGIIKMKIEKLAVIDIDEKEQNRDSLARILNIIKSAGRDFDSYFERIEELHQTGAINDICYTLLIASLAQFSAASLDLATTIDAIKKTMELN